MNTLHQYGKVSIFLFVWLGLLLLSACNREKNYIGTYISTEKNSPKFKDLRVELHRGGKGIRWAGGEEVTFEWEVKYNEIRIQTSAGGILLAKLRHDVLEVSLPGPETIYLKKIH